MKRRHLLKHVSVAGSLSLTGCSSIQNFVEQGTVLGRIEIANYSFTSNRIHLYVVRGEETLLDQMISLAPIDAEDGESGRWVEPSWSKEEAEYKIIAVHYDESGNRETGGSEYTFTQADYTQYYGESHKDPGCIGAFVKIGSLTHSANTEIGIGPVNIEDPCRLPDSRYRLMSSESNQTANSEKDTSGR